MVNDESTPTDVTRKDDVVVQVPPVWHALSIDEVFVQLELRGEDDDKDVAINGLTSIVAASRLEKYGPNKLSEKEKVSLLMRIWKLVSNVLVAILVIVLIVSLTKGIIAKSVEDRVTNFIEVALITFVIVYVSFYFILQFAFLERKMWISDTHVISLWSILAPEKIVYQYFSFFICFFLFHHMFLIDIHQMTV
jgi:Cation transporter/ATPase, N-terminus